MTAQKNGPLVLLMFTVLCALPAAAVVGVIPSAFAQEEDNNEANFAPQTNEPVAIAINDQDQGAANLGANLASNVDTEEIIEEARSATPTEEEPPEFVAFCFVSGFSPSPFCFNTSEECENAEEFLGGFTPNVSDCEGVEVLPPDALSCVNLDEQGEIVTVSCGPPEDT